MPFLTILVKDSTGQKTKMTIKVPETKVRIQAYFNDDQINMQTMKFPKRREDERPRDREDDRAGVGENDRAGLQQEQRPINPIHEGQNIVEDEDSKA